MISEGLGKISNASVRMMLGNLLCPAWTNALHG